MYSVTVLQATARREDLPQVLLVSKVTKNTIIQYNTIQYKFIDISVFYLNNKLNK